MAQGDLTLFEEFADQLGNAIHNFENGGNTFKVMLINNSTVATAGDTTPTKTDYTECSGSGYTAGGDTVDNQSYDEASGVATYDGDDVGWTQNASGPSDIYQAVLYNDTDASDTCIGFIDMTTDGGTTPLDLADGDITIQFHTSGIFTVTVT